MKRIFTTFFFLFCCLFFAKAQTWELNLRHDYAAYFAEAYSNYPAIPRGVLESVTYTNTRIRYL